MLFNMAAMPLKSRDLVLYAPPRRVHNKIPTYKRAVVQAVEGVAQTGSQGPGAHYPSSEEERSSQGAKMIAR